MAWCAGMLSGNLATCLTSHNLVGLCKTSAYGNLSYGKIRPAETYNRPVETYCGSLQEVVALYEVTDSCDP